jgi:uncharacterized protein (DUF697 family)
VSVAKKSLPKAIRTTTVDAREASAGPGASEQRERLAVAATSSERLDSRSAAAKPVHASDIIDEPPEASAQASPASPTALVHMAPMGAGIDATRRRSQANSIVERHTAYAAVGGIIPVPIANVASITAVIVRMVKRLSDLYGIPFERDRARAIVVGLMGGAMPTGLGAVTTSTLFYVVPGSGLVGLAVSSIAAVACTRSIGRIFVEHFETGSSLHDLSATART